jgi:uncharacterized protein YjbI with pentapeptide repeats
MATKSKSRVEPRIELDLLTETFQEQLASGTVRDAIVSDEALPSLLSPRGQAIRMDRCVWRTVTISDPKARRLELHDGRIENSNLANIDLTEGFLERVEIASTRLTGAICTEAHLKSILFDECKLDFAVVRMTKLTTCEFVKCNLTDADLYGADLTGAVFRGCDLSRADISHAKLAGADIRDCRLDGIRGVPANTDGLLISPDQAALLITLFGIRVAW